MWSILFSPDDRTRANGSNDMMLQLWEASTGKELNRREGLSWPVWSAMFSPDGMIHAKVSNDMRLQLREASTGKELARR